MYNSQIQLDNFSSSHLDLSQYCLHYPSEGDGVALLCLTNGVWLPAFQDKHNRYSSL